MLKQSVPNAKDVLPKGLLSKLQRHCSGLVYIPAPQTRAEMNMSRVRSLHIRGHKPAQIAGIVGLSTRHIRDIIKRFEDGGIRGLRKEYKIYETIPQEIVELVQRHICGTVYVPPKASQAERRRARVKRMLNKDLCVSEIAKRTGLSERRVWQIKAELEDARTRLDKNQTHRHNWKDPFDVDHNRDVEEHTPPRICPDCRSVLRPDEQDCEMCEWRNATMSRKDSDVIVVSHLPFAVIDRQF